MDIIATIPPYVSHISTITSTPIISALRFNTIMPIGESKFDVISFLKNQSTKPLWVDLKCRQLRIDEFAYLPYSYVTLNHKIKVDKLPVDIYFKDCVGEIVDIVDGDKLILRDRPQRVVGKGEPVNILDPSFVIIDDFLLTSDIQYIDACKKLDVHNYMLSFCESYNDIKTLVDIDPDAKIIAKIESKKGMDFVNNEFHAYDDNIHLMAARDDLYINIGYNNILDALHSISNKDSNAVLASHILTSLESKDVPNVGEILDVVYWSKYYNTIMLSDGVCFNGKAFHNVIKVLHDILK